MVAAGEFGDCPACVGAVVVGGGMLAKALYDRRQAKKARAKGDAQILEDAADA